MTTAADRTAAMTTAADRSFATATCPSGPSPPHRHRRRQEGIDRHPRRPAGERAVVEGAAPGRAGAWADHRAEAGHRRRRLGVLEGGAAVVVGRAGAALLGA